MTDKITGGAHIEIDHDDTQITALCKVINETTKAFCGHPETPDYTIGQVIAALVGVLSLQFVNGGCDTEERLQQTLEGVSNHLATAVRFLWAQIEAEKQNKQKMN